MKKSDHETSARAPARPASWLTASEMRRASRFRACVVNDLLPSDVVPAPSPRGNRWGQGPLVQSRLLQLGSAPRQQRRRQPR